MKKFTIATFLFPLTAALMVHAAPPSADQATAQPGAKKSPEVYTFREFEWLNDKDAKAFNFPHLRAESRREMNGLGKAVASREEARKYLNSHMSMAMPPTVGYEDAKYYYLSGGQTGGDVRDFSEGFIISKTTSELRRWGSQVNDFRPFEWLTDIDAKEFNFSNILAASKVEGEAPKKTYPVLSREEALEHLNTHISMARPPSAGYEDAQYFYLSGGLSGAYVTDFSAGFVINKTSGELRRWEK